MEKPQVIARACNLRETTKDPAGHAEFLAMKRAAEVLDAWRLTDCTVYVTLEPCVMCAGLMHQARVRRCVYGAADPKAGALGTLYAVNEDKRLNHTFEAVPGVLGGECARMLRDFFSRKRAKKSQKQEAKDMANENGSPAFPSYPRRPRRTVALVDGCNVCLVCSGVVPCTVRSGRAVRSGCVVRRRRLGCR